MSLDDLLTLPPLGLWLAPTPVASARAGGAGGGEDPPPRGRRGEVADALRFIEEHLAEPFDVGDLSRRAGLSRPHFTRVFKEEEGVPPWTYVLDRRVRRAAELLEEGAPPSEAAWVAGFCDQSHLSRVFRKATGTTPGEYRRERASREGGEGPEDPSGADSTNVQDGEDEAA